ncbi:MAG: hypothetical protein HY529_01860 [Chloroflexi bacterium]|nr:hypothetical protein [Chloroflexota bacterium]
MNRGQTLEILVKGIFTLIDLAPTPKPPKIDYMQVDDFMPNQSSMTIFVDQTLSEDQRSQKASPCRRQ